MIGDLLSCSSGFTVCISISYINVALKFDTLVISYSPEEIGKRTNEGEFEESSQSEVVIRRSRRKSSTGRTSVEMNEIVEGSRMSSELKTIGDRQETNGDQLNDKSTIRKRYPPRRRCAPNREIHYNYEPSTRKRKKTGAACNGVLRTIASITKAELQRWEKRGMDKDIIFGLKCNDLAACISAFLTYYDHDIADKYLELKRELGHCFRTNLVGGPFRSVTFHSLIWWPWMRFKFRSTVLECTILGTA